MSGNYTPPVQFTAGEQRLIDLAQKQQKSAHVAEGTLVQRRVALGKTLLELRGVCRRGYWIAALGVVGIEQHAAWKAMRLASLTPAQLEGCAFMTEALEIAGLKRPGYDEAQREKQRNPGRRRVAKRNLRSAETAVREAKKELLENADPSKACALILSWVAGRAAKHKVAAA